jgi:hypothetical protein
MIQAVLSLFWALAMAIFRALEAQFPDEPSREFSEGGQGNHEN